MIKKMLKSKRAISPILATLLLIVIAVAAIVVTYAWIMTYMTSAGTQAGTWIRIDSATINATTDMVTIYVRNTGTEPATIDAVYIEGTDVTTSVEQPTLSYTLPVEGRIPITVNGTKAGFDFVAGSSYKIKVTTTTGATTGDVPVQAR
ncbi:MAG: archaellin/type IV pilin N-terminal domain-containing protein [Candidatus Bathyarchaeia archaeon]